MHIASSRQRGDQLLMGAIVGSILANVVSLLLFLAPVDDDPPAFAYVVTVIFAVAALVAAWGLWQRRRWAKWLTVVVTALNILSGLPVFGAGPSAALVIGIIIATIIGIAVIVLLFQSDVSAQLT